MNNVANIIEGIKGGNVRLLESPLSVVRANGNVQREKGKVNLPCSSVAYSDKTTSGTALRRVTGHKCSI